MKLGIAFSLALLATPAHAHDKWKNGDPVPAWVKESCCGPADAHQVDESQVSRDGPDYVIKTTDGLTLNVSASRALPSQDGAYWIFYAPHQDNPPIYCFFIPVSG